MQNPTTATSPLLLALLLACGPANAAPVGQVTHLSGPLFALTADGGRRVLSSGSQVEPGETLVTEDKTYAQVRFNDKGLITLKPGSHFKIESYVFDEKAPEKDGAVFGLLKGALRTVTGAIGKRGNQDAYKMNTATATIGIRGTSFGATLCPSPACPANLPAGTYVDVFEGQVAVAPPPVPAVPGIPAPPSPEVLVLSAGQFGFVPPVGSAQQLPNDPGVSQQFKPPPSFQNTQQQPTPGSSPTSVAPQGASAPNQEGCIVR